MSRLSTPRSLSTNHYESGEAAAPTICFYRANEKPYGAFSNLFPRAIEFEGVTYATSEHAYQAGKANKPAVREWILNAPTPALAAMAAHGLYVWDVVPNWAQVKFDRMRAVLRAKFDQHADLRSLLLATGDARLIEAGTVNNAVNRLWGEVNGKGENMLGVMLMELRTAYRQHGGNPASLNADLICSGQQGGTPEFGTFPEMPFETSNLQRALETCSGKS